MSKSALFRGGFVKDFLGESEMRRKRRNEEEFFIGMVGSSYTVNRKHRKRKKRANKKLLFRALIIAACVLVVAGIAALTAFVIVPFFQSLASATPDEATKDEVQVVETTAAPTEAATTTAPETTVAETTTVPATTVPPTTAVTPVISAHIKPDIADDGSKAEMATNTICIWNKQAFNLFYSGNKAAEYYADAINGYAKKLDKDVKVYNMVVGNHTEFGLPERLIKGGIQTDSQSDNIKHIIDNLSDRVTPIDCYNNLAEHCNEYIFYGTDHHWTALGAYYGYEAFCETLGLTPMDIAKSEKSSVDGFLGSLYTATGSSTLAENTDTVDYYSLPNNTYALMNERMSSSQITVDVYYPAAAAGDLTYGVFCWGDTAQFVIHSDCGTGRKIAVVKDSFANAFAPYLSANYDEVHLIDYRYWYGDLNDYLKANGIKEVLFLNNTMSANTASQVDSISNVFG